MQEHDIVISLSPIDVFQQYQEIFTEDSLKFIAELFVRFEDKINELYDNRSFRKYELRTTKQLPRFKDTDCRRDQSWKIAPIPKRLQNRHLDLGDVSPSNPQVLINALKQNVQGVQVDFDDGHCPTWKNQILGHYNIRWVVHQQTDVLKNIPIMMLRPRAWNMIEHNIMVNGRKLPGPVVDFGLLMYHNAKILYESESGPYFYLSKLEGASEAKLWNEIFVWTQEKLGLPDGTIKVCVLIENILASYEIDEILYELKAHCIGLNCGIWDYAASIIAKFGDNKQFLLPDRKKYVNMQQHFLKKYMTLVIQVCHKRGALATGGMAAVLVDTNPEDAIHSVKAAKTLEIEAGVDGFMVYDTRLIESMEKLWKEITHDLPNQINYIPDDVINETDLLTLPKGKVTWEGLLHNIEITIGFIYSWLKGFGSFFNNGFVEDSATAEISRSQIWQWIRHQAQIEDKENATVTPTLVADEIEKIVAHNNNCDHFWYQTAANIAMELFTSTAFPDFITTYLNDHYMLAMRQENIQKNKL